MPERAPTMYSPNRPRGFTLVELLVVITIIALLIALGLPAVQHDCETVRCATCATNLKPIGLALLNSESTWKRFPISARRSDGFGPSWWAGLLPHLMVT